MSRTILIAIEPTEIPEGAVERVQSLAPDARVIVTGKQEEFEPLLDDIEVAAGHFPVQWLMRAPHLRWYQQWGAGTDWLMRHPEAAAKDFTLTNASGVHAIPISEHILALMLAFARRLPESIRAQARHDWKTARQPAFELAGKTMLLVGVGAIGRRTAQLAAALGMRVIGVRKNAGKAPGIERMLGVEEIDLALPQADFVVLTLPLTAESRGLISAARLAKMKRSAYLINIGRGGTVDEAALIEALKTGQIAGAGLDVFIKEPLPEESPLWDLENVIITAHYAGDTPHYDERAMDIFIDNLARYLKGEPLKNVVDKQRGY